MKSSVWRLLAAIGVTFSVSVVGLAAPNGEEGVTTAVRPGLVTDPTTDAQITAPEYNGVFVYVCANGPYNTDSVWHQGMGDCNLVSGVLEKPVVANWAKDRDKEFLRGPFVSENDLEGSLVRSWELSADFTTLVLNLREGVRWHDKAPLDGRPFEPSDLDEYLEHLFGLVENDGQCKAGPMCSMNVASIGHTTNPSVTLHLERPSFFQLVDFLDSSRMFVFPPELLKNGYDSFDWRDLVGTGPYMLADYVEKTSISWHRNPNYWGVDEKFPRNHLPYVGEVQALIVPDAEMRETLFLTGQIDFLGIDRTSISVDALPEFMEHGKELWDTWLAVHAFGVNVNNLPLSILEVRAAMQMALDLPTINQNLFGDLANWTPTGQVGDTLSEYYTPFEEWPDELQERYTYNPSKAGEWLDAAGYPRGADGTRFETNLYLPDSFDQRYTEDAIDFWREIGIIVKTRRLDWREYDLMAQESSLKDLAWTFGARQYFNESFATRWYGGAQYNPAAVDDPGMNELIDALIEARRNYAVADFQRLFRAIDMYAIDQHWTIWGPAAPTIRATQPWVKGYNGEFRVGRGNTNALFARLWIDSALKSQMGD